MKLLKTPYLTAVALLGIGAATALQSCSMVNEDMDPCAQKPNTFVHVDFVYDYNMLREDLFDAHAGTAHLYVFNEDSVFLFDRSLSKNDMTGKVDFSMTFDTLYFVPGHKYMLVAMAQGNHSGYDWACVSTPGFQIPIDREMVPGVSKISDYRIVLDRDSDSYADIGVVNYKDAYGNNKELMDTLWSTRPNMVQDIDVPYVEWLPQKDTVPANHIYVEVPMMRITNAIKVNLIHDSFDQTTNPDDYIFLIDFPNGNGTVGFTGTTYPNRELFYRSLRKQVSVYTPKSNHADYESNNGVQDPAAVSHYSGGVNTRATQYCIEAQFGVSRLQTTDGSKLQIRNARDNSILAEIPDFANWLAQYFEDEHYYDNQEFLDREFNFTVDIHIDDNGKNDWIQIGCAILGWGKRIHYYDI